MLDLSKVMAADDRFCRKLGESAQFLGQELLRILNLIQLIEYDVDLGKLGSIRDPLPPYLQGEPKLGDPVCCVDVPLRSRNDISGVPILLTSCRPLFTRVYSGQLGYNSNFIHPACIKMDRFDHPVLRRDEHGTWQTKDEIWKMG